MKNTLFNRSKLKRYAKDKDFKLNYSKKQILLEHLKKLEHGLFEKETSNYDKFEHHILIDLLGYDIDDNILFDEPVDKGPRRSEFALINGKEKFLIVELKGQFKSLDKPQISYGNKTAVEQAFDYSLKTNSANWIIVSNYDEIRLYNWEKKQNYISFKFEELMDPTIFSYFMVAFSKKSHIDNSYPKKILKKTLTIGRDFEENFYKLYHETRLMLIKELEITNGLKKESAIHYAQAILNRYMFICFAEDIEQLLPEDISTNTICRPIKEGDISKRSIWNRLNELFSYINEGNEFKKINKYNGGLFKDDFSFITIRDLVDPSFFKDTRQKWDLKEYGIDVSTLMGPHGSKISLIYWNLLTMSSFDFSSERDVNILGHIFENSIGDIEELKNDNKQRRKSEGIFYTQDYITDYVCRNTIIPYLSKSGNLTDVKDLVGDYWGSKIYDLDEKVKNIKILDPACGSGAFLNKAADILVEIHEAIHEHIYKDKKSTLIPYFDNIGKRREVIKNNIYGVDLNEESVEITKLGLFLKVCQKNLTLPDIDENIKCGNSIIDDSKYTDKPFIWEKEFSEIFKDGGFDVIIGNPPWGAEFNEKTKEFIENNYNQIEYQINSYVVFLEKTYFLLKDKGILGLITPPTWLYMHYFKKIRSFLITQNTFLKIVYLKYHAFDDVTSESSIVCYKKTKPENLHEILNKRVVNIDEFENKEYSLTPQNIWIESSVDGFLFGDEIELFNKFYKNSERLSYFADLTTGIKPYQTNKGTPPQTRKDVEKKVYSAVTPINETYKPYLVGGNITRYNIDYPTNQWLSYGPWIAEPRQSLDFSKVKIVIRRTSDRIFATIDEKGYLNLNSTHNLIIKEDSDLNLKYILCLLNSSLMHYIYSNLVPDEGRVFSEVKIVNLEKLPIYAIALDKQQPFIEKAEQMLKINKELQYEINGFKNWIKKEFDVEKLSKKLNNYYELSVDEFISEMKKKKVNTKQRKNREHLEYEYNESLAIITPLLQKINKIDKEIDKLIYKLYNLTKNEIKIIEKSIK